MNIGPAEFTIVIIACGMIAGLIARSRFGTMRSFAVFFVVGSLFPVAGVLAAYLVKRYLPQSVTASSA